MSPCVTTPLTLAALMAGACLQGGESTFSNWQVDIHGDAQLFDPAAVEVRPGSFGRGDGVQIQGGFTTRSFLNVMIRYTVSGPDPYVAALLYLGAGGGDPGSVAVLVETIQPPSKPLFTAVGGPAFVWEAIPKVTTLHVLTHVYLHCPAGVPCEVSLSEFQQDFLREAVP